MNACNFSVQFWLKNNILVVFNVTTIYLSIPWKSKPIILWYLTSCCVVAFKWFKWQYLMCCAVVVVLWLCFILLHCGCGYIVLCFILMWCDVMWCVVLCCVVLCYVVLHSIVVKSAELLLFLMTWSLAWVQAGQTINNSPNTTHTFYSGKVGRIRP